MNADLLSVLLPFLQPRELVHVRRLSRWYHYQTDAWLVANIGSARLENWVCPMCADWKSTDILTDYTGFFQAYTLLEERRLMRRIRGFFPTHWTLERTALLCESCEYTEHELDTQQPIQRALPWSGDRKYELVVLKDVAVLSQSLSEHKTRWNQFRLVIPHLN